MNCRTVREYLEAYLDSELETAQTVAVNSHLETCAACRRRFESERRIEEAIGEHLRSGLEDDERAFESVLASVVGQRGAKAGSPVWRPRVAVAVAGLAIVVVLAWLFLGQLFGQHGADLPVLVQAAAADHDKFRTAGIQPDIDDAHSTDAVRRYLEPRLGVVCPHLPEGPGWQILGPRICKLRDVRVGVVLLEHDHQLVSLFLLTEEGARNLGWRVLAKPRCFPLRKGSSHAVVGGDEDNVWCAVGSSPLADLERLATGGAR